MRIGGDHASGANVLAERSAHGPRRLSEITETEWVTVRWVDITAHGDSERFFVDSHQRSPDERAKALADLQALKNAGLPSGLADEDTSGWISVKDRLPSSGERVDFWVERPPTATGADHSFNERGTYNTYGDGKWSIRGEYALRVTDDQYGTVTHWRPIAPAPLDRRRQ